MTKVQDYGIMEVLGINQKVGPAIQVKRNNKMTHEEEKEVIRVCGPDYEEADVPAYIRKRDLEKLDQEEIDDLLADWHPRPEDVN